MTNYLYNLPNATNGTDAILQQTANAVPGFTPLLLLFIFFVVSLGGIARQKLRTGTADYSLWFVIGSLGTFMATLILSVLSGFIRLDWLVIVIAITILSGVWFFLDRKPSEI